MFCTLRAGSGRGFVGCERLSPAGDITDPHLENEKANETRRLTLWPECWLDRCRHAWGGRKGPSGTSGRTRCRRGQGVRQLRNPPHPPPASVEVEEPATNFVWIFYVIDIFIFSSVIHICSGRNELPQLITRPEASKGPLLNGTLVSCARQAARGGLPMPFASRGSRRGQKYCTSYKIITVFGED